MQNLTRRGFCAAAGAGLVVLHVPACGGANGVPFVADDGGLAGPDGGDGGDAGTAMPDLSGTRPDMAQHPADMARMQQPDMAKPSPCLSMTTVNAGPANGIALDTATFFTCGGTTRIFVCRDAKGVYALSAICPHAGCSCNFDMGNLDFACPCHGSRFNFNGGVTAGPALSPLAHYLCTLDGNGNVIVDHTKSVATTTRI